MTGKDINKPLGKYIFFTLTKSILSIICSIICTLIFIVATEITEFLNIFNITGEGEPNILLFGIVILFLPITLFYILFIKTSNYINLLGKIVTTFGVFILFFSISNILVWIEIWFTGPNPITFNEFIYGLKSFYWKWYLPFLFSFLILLGILLIVWGIYILRKKRIFKAKKPIHV